MTKTPKVSDHNDDKPRQPLTDRQKKDGAKILALIGIGLICIGGLLMGYSVYENSKTVEVDGTVLLVEVLEKRGSSGTVRNIHHTFEYVVEGVTLTAIPPGDGWKEEFDVGDVVAIGYYPEDISHIRIRSWFKYSAAMKVFLFLGGVLLWLAYQQFRRPKNETQD